MERTSARWTGTCSSSHGHGGLQALVRDLNHVYRDEPALWERDDDHEGFGWLEANDADANVVAFVRWGAATPSASSASATCRRCRARATGSACRARRAGREVLNTDAGVYGGANVGNLGGVEAEAQPGTTSRSRRTVTLPPLGVVWLVPDPLC